MEKTIIHYGLHFLAPLFIALLIDKKNWKKNYLILISTMLVDIDHLLAESVFEINRCSIGFHPLHSFPPICIYAGTWLFTRRGRILNTIAAGLIFHMFTDFTDCLMIWASCSG